MLESSSSFPDYEGLEPNVLRRFAYLAPFAPSPATFQVDDLMYVWSTSLEEAQNTIELLIQRGLLKPSSDAHLEIQPHIRDQAEALLKTL